MGNIYFIGFIAEDRERIARLKQVIEGFGWAVDWDAEVPTKKNWPDVLMPRVQAASCVLVAWTARATENRWTAVEADVAQEHRRLVSVLLDDVELPRAFREMDSVDLIRWGGDPQGGEMEFLVSQLSAIAGPPPNPTSQPGGWNPEAPTSEPNQPRISADPQPHNEPRPVPLTLVQGGAQPNHSATRADQRSIPIAGERQGIAAVEFQERLSTQGDQDLEGELAFIPGIYGWAVAWTLGLSAIGLYVRGGVDLDVSAAIYLGNHLYSALTGSTVGLIGALFMLYALQRQRICLSHFQKGVILLGWYLGGGLGLVATTALNLPVVGVASGVVGFEIGWVFCWIIGGSVGGAFTWLALRRSNRFLTLKDLALTAGGFSAGSVIGWIGGWILLSLPAMLFSWVIGKVITEGSAPEVGEVMTLLMSLALIGAGGGAVFGLAGGLLLFGTLTRAEAQGKDSV